MQNPTKLPMKDLTVVKLQAYNYTYLKLHTLHTFIYISNMTKTELLHKYFSKILVKFSENLFAKHHLITAFITHLKA